MDQTNINENAAVTTQTALDIIVSGAKNAALKHKVRIAIVRDTIANAEDGQTYPFNFCPMEAVPILHRHGVIIGTVSETGVVTVRPQPMPVPPQVLEEIMGHEMERTGQPDLTEEFYEYATYFENYATDAPGYAGPVVVVVWPAAPEAISTFVKRDGRWVHCNSSGHE